MTVFVAAAVALAIAALVLILRPLISSRARRQPARAEVNVAVYRAQAKELDGDLQNGLLTPEEHAKARGELEARLIRDVEAGEGVAAPVRPSRKTALALAALIPLGALALYLAVGSPVALDPNKLKVAGVQIDRQQLAEMVEKLAQKLKEDPENGIGWAMLARSYRYFGRYEDAAKAYANAIPRLQPDASLLADYADTLASAQGKLQGEPEKLIAQALKIDPNNLKALALAGSAAFDSKNYARAVQYWEQMAPLVPPGSEDAKAIEANITEARQLAGTPVTTQPSARAAAKAQVSGIVELAPDLAKNVSPTDTVLIYARAAEGPRMPLAIVRREARELPIRFTLDDSMAMAPGMTLSKIDRVVIVARVSKSASAVPKPGDLEGASAPVANTAQDVRVSVNSVVK